ncbi:hypothetical protein D3C83_91430 [compost metagenome]
MRWHRIAIHSHDADIAQASATALIERILKAYREAGAPSQLEIWHRKHSAMDHEYFLSPKASEILVPLLAGYRPTPCEAPDVRALKQVLL